MFSAGILPYDGEHFLLGKQNGGWTTFSGKSKAGETPNDTAIREFAEETAGVFPEIDIAGVQPLVTHTPRGFAFYLFCVRVPRNPEHSTAFLHRRSLTLSPDYREMQQVAWIHVADLERTPLRTAFRVDLPKILSIIEKAAVVTVER